MGDRGGVGRLLGLVAFVGTAAVAGPLLRAQLAPWTSPFPLILTPERAQAFALAAEKRLPYVPGEVVIKFRDGVGVAAQSRALQALRDEPPASNLEWQDGVALLRDRREFNAEILASQLASQPEVEYAEPNYLYRSTAIPNDPSFSTRQWNFGALDLPRAWDINPGGNPNLIVAIVDTGVTTVSQSFTFPTWNGVGIENVSVPFAVNPDLSASRHTGARDFVFWGGAVLDMTGHGTHVSSTVGEDTNNRLAGAGIAYQTRIMPLKACLGYWEVQFILSSSGVPGAAPRNAGGCPSSAIAQAIQYAADAGAKVINLSVGGPAPSVTIQNALRYAVGRGAFVAIAAGNSFEVGNPIEYPGGYAPAIEGAMSVGAVGPSLARAFYSNTGAHVEIAAPGGSSREGGSAGLIWQSTLSPGDLDERFVLFPRFDRYFEVGYQGTSMATPHVAGIAALLMAQGVTDPAAVEALIKATARDLGSPGRDNEFGFGLVQPRAALFGFGVGR
jgi:serine protease